MVQRHQKQPTEAQGWGVALRGAFPTPKVSETRVGVEARVRPEHPLAALLPCDNVLAIESRWYRGNPLVIKWAGARVADVTAGRFSPDNINRTARKLLIRLRLPDSGFARSGSGAKPGAICLFFVQMRFLHWRR